MEISVKTEGATVATRKLTAMADHLTDFRPVWPEVKRVVERHQQKWLGSEGEGSFAPLAASTLKRPRRSSHPLDLTGAMWDSLTGITGLTVFTSEQFRCEIGTGADWAHWHMFNRVHMPARPPIKITATLIGDVGHVLRGHVRGGQKVLL